MNVLIGIAVVAGVALVGWLLSKDKPGERITSDESRDSLRHAVEDEEKAGRQPVIAVLPGDTRVVGLTDRQLAGAGAGVAIGAAILGPLGGAIGFGWGAFAGAVADAVNHESYGTRVRDALKDWLRGNGFKVTSANVDALIFRNALLGAPFVWVHENGTLAIEITAKGSDVRTSLEGRLTLGTGEEFLPGFAGVQSRQQMTRRSQGQLDGPDQRERYRQWVDGARVGQLYALALHEGEHRSWRSPGYVWFYAGWPLVSQSPTAKTSRWERTVVTAGNVDRVCAWYDKAVGADFSQEG